MEVEKQPEIQEQVAAQQNEHLKESMQILAAPKDEEKRGLRILTLDGGGIRGLVTLKSLAYLSQMCVDDASGKKFVDYFDLIAGTSTGGILALGITKGMTVEQGHDLYMKLGSQVFSSTYWQYSTRMFHYAASGMMEYYSSDQLAEYYKQSFGDGPLEIPDEKTFFLVSTDASKCFVQPYLFRSYDIENSIYDGTAHADVVTALRATSAAPSYFKGIQFDGRTLLDGGVIANNPTEIALLEASKLFPNRKIECIVSLGTGQATDPVAKVSNLFEVVGQIVDISTDSHTIHKRVKNWLDLTLPETNYFRFDPPGVGNYKLDCAIPKVLDDMQSDTLTYLEEEKQQEQILKLRKLMATWKPSKDDPIPSPRPPCPLINQNQVHDEDIESFVHLDASPDDVAHVDNQA